MAYVKTTSISGYKDGKFKTVQPNGHWKLETAIRYARRLGLHDKITITHNVFDLSGLGRGGRNGRWQVDDKDNIARLD